MQQYKAQQSRRGSILVLARLSVLSANVIIHYNEARQCTLNSAFKH